MHDNRRNVEAGEDPIDHGREWARVLVVVTRRSEQDEVVPEPSFPSDRLGRVLRRNPNHVVTDAIERIRNVMRVRSLVWTPTERPPSVRGVNGEHCHLRVIERLCHEIRRIAAVRTSTSGQEDPLASQDLRRRVDRLSPQALCLLRWDLPTSHRQAEELGSDNRSCDRGEHQNGVSRHTRDPEVESDNRDDDPHSSKGRQSGTELHNPDFAALARAYGAHGEVVAHTHEFPDAFERARKAGRAALIELRVDPEAITPLATISDIREKALTRIAQENGKG